MIIKQRLSSTPAMILMPIAGVLSTSSAHAAIITIEGSGVITSVASGLDIDTNSDSVSDFQVGDVFTVDLQIDTSIIDSWAFTPLVGVYNDAIISQTVTLGDHQFGTEGGVVSTSFESVRFSATNSELEGTIPSINGKQLQTYSYSLNSVSDVISDDSMSIALSALQDFDDSRNATWLFGRSAIRGDFNSVTVIPEPGTVGLIAGGFALAAAAGMRRMRRREGTVSNDDQRPSTPQA